MVQVVHRTFRVLIPVLFLVCSQLYAQNPEIDVVYEHNRAYDAGPVKGLLIEENNVTEMYPLLTYLFFDEGSAVIAERYIRFTDPVQTENFTDTTIPGGTLQKYYHLLNVIGYRLRKYPGTRIEIVGCNSQQPDLGETMEVSGERGRGVYEYLLRMWGIDSSRVALLPPRNYPEARSNPRDPLANVENRRVEIRSKDWDIMKPIVNTEIRRYPYPDDIVFRMANGIHPSIVDHRVIEIRRNGKLWYVMKGVGIVDTISPPFNWGRNDNADSIPEEELPYTVQLVVVVKDGTAHRSKEVEIPVEIITQEEKIRKGLVDSVIQRCWIPYYTLPDMTNPGALNERILHEFVCGRLRPGARIEVTGHTNATGLDDRSSKLAERRARTVADFIRRCAEKEGVAIGVITARGVGEWGLLYSNELPEGRCYNRTVAVVITTPAGP